MRLSPKLLPPREAAQAARRQNDDSGPGGKRESAGLGNCIRVGGVALSPLQGTTGAIHKRDAEAKTSHRFGRLAGDMHRFLEVGEVYRDWTGGRAAARGG